jgi:23S rRNA (adenine-N6)-dimethyltransferase
MSRHHLSIIQRRPELSQHFLRDARTARRLVASLPIATHTVVEIGAGTGLLTDALAARGFRVIAIEKDARLFRALRERMLGRTNVECHHGDFLGTPMPAGAYSVVANLPFSISAATVRRLTSAPHPPEDAFLVLQREAAQKFAGVPHETLISLLIKPSFETSIALLFRRSDFDPLPRVRPALLHIRRRAVPLLSGASLTGYRRLVSSTFGASPEIGSALRTQLSRRQIVRLARDLCFSASARVSELTFPQWLAIARFYEHACMGRDPAPGRRLPALVSPAYNALRVSAIPR